MLADLYDLLDGALPYDGAMRWTPPAHRGTPPGRFIPAARRAQLLAEQTRRLGWTHGNSPLRAAMATAVPTYWPDDTRSPA